MPKPTTKSLQESLFQRIRELLPPGKNLADVIAGVLNVGQDSAYRRIRGETLLVLDEAHELCKHFNISLDDLFGMKNDSVVFHRTEIDATAYDFNRYLEGMFNLLTKLDSYREKSIFYLAKGIPLFHVFPYRPLLAFRYYFWMRTTVEVPALLKQKFSEELLPASAEEMGLNILSLYNKIPSTEIWSTECINSTLLQIEFCRDAGLMTAQQANNVIGSLQQMLEHLQAQTEWGRKFLPAQKPESRKDNFSFFYNRMGLGNDTILTVQEGRKTLYVNNDALDYLTCADEGYCNKVHQKMQTITRRSTLISGVSEKERNMFFNALYAKLPLR